MADEAVDRPRLETQTATPGALAAEMVAAPGRGGRRLSSYATRDLTTGSIPRHLWFLGWPMVVSGVLQTVDSVLDLFWAGRGFGARSIAGLGVAQQWSQLTMTMRGGLDISTRAMVARAVGAGDIPLANQVAIQSFVFSGGISLLFMVVGVLLTEFLLRLMGVSERVIAESADYMRWGFVSMTSMALMMAGGSVLQAAGDTLTPMKTQLVTRLIHPILSPFLAFGWWGFPTLGLMGLAVANVIAQSAGIVWLYWVLFTGRSRIHFTFRDYRIDWRLLWRMAVIGAPGAVTNMERSLAQLLLVRLLSPFGDMAFAAYFLTQRLQMLGNLGSMGLGQAAGILVGQNLGAKKVERAKHSMGWALLYVMVIKAVLVGILVAFPRQFLSIFNRQPELLEVAVPWLYIIAISFLLMGPAMVFLSSYQTAGDTVMPMLTTLVGMWLVELPLAIVLSGIGANWTLFGSPVPLLGLVNLGQYGIAWSITISMGARMTLYVLYFFWGPWMKKEVLPDAPRRPGMGMGAMH